MNGKRGRRLQRECQGEYHGYDCVRSSELFRSRFHLISPPLGEGVLAPLHLEEGILAPLVELPGCRPARTRRGGDRPAGEIDRISLPPSDRLPTAARWSQPKSPQLGGERYLAPSGGSRDFSVTSRKAS